ncbi:MAG: CRISPR-associated protein Cas4 [Ruminococcus sp.]|nr:CRISPR-associated protein Cas4 [Ruminococcus sp.]
MEYNQDDFLMLSGIQHFVFCRRQWSLIHLDLLWEENLLTAEGRQLHEKCHDAFSSENRGDVIISCAMSIFSRTLGVSGECDVVEFKRSEKGITLAGHEGCYTVFPVEYKRGSPKEDDCDILQLAAQAMCLEEMLVCEINYGALYYGEPKRRLQVEITSEMKQRVRDIFAEMHQYFRSGHIPKVKTSRRCSSCSLKELCMTKFQGITDVKKYLDESLGTGGEPL